MARRPLKPRSDDGGYDNRAHGRSDSYLPADDHTLKDTLGPVTLIRPKLKDGPFRFRAWPQLSPSDPNNKLLPGRKSVDERAQTQWICRVPVAMFIGCRDKACTQDSFVLHHPKDRNVRGMNPYRELYWTCKNACKAGNFGQGRKWDSDWNKLMVGEKGKGAPMSAPTSKWYLQGIVYQNGTRIYAAGEDRRDGPLGTCDGDDLVIIQLANSIGDNLLNMLDQRKVNVPDDADEEKRPWELFKYGDAIGIHTPSNNPGDESDRGSVAGGLILTAFDPRASGEAFVNNKAMSWDGDMKALRKNEFSEHHIALSKKLTLGKHVFTPDLDKEQTARVFDKAQFWWDDPATGQEGLILVPSVEEQCLRIAKAFRTVPRLLEFAWSENPEYMTSDVIGVLRSRRSEVVPGLDDERDEEPVTGSADDDGGFEDEAAAPAPAPVKGKTDPTMAGAATAAKTQPAKTQAPASAAKPAAPAAKTTLKTTLKTTASSTAMALAAETAEPASDDAFPDDGAKLPPSRETVTEGGEDEFGDDGSPSAEASTQDSGDDFGDGVEAAATETPAEENPDEFDGEEVVLDTTPSSDGSDEFQEPVVGDGVYSEEGEAVEGEAAATGVATADGNDPDEQVGENEKRMQASMEAARLRAGKRATKTPEGKAAAPAAAPAAPAAASKSTPKSVPKPVSKK